jgi:glycosyltransferase involved in cell wall biosynthesis
MVSKLLTVVIPCKNESELINHTLVLLNKQFKINGTRVIISDSSDDNTREVILNSTYENLEIEIIDGGFPSVARNNGAKISKTPYILFLDADIFLNDEFTIYDILHHTMDYCYDLSTCKFTTNGKYSYVYPIFDFIMEYLFPRTPFVYGGFMLFYLDKFNEIGGFDEDEKFAEDFRVSQKIKPICIYKSDRKILTTERRFIKKGLFYMIKMAILSKINKNNPNFFKNDHNYWL